MKLSGFMIATNGQDGDRATASRRWRSDRAKLALPAGLAVDKDLLTVQQ